MTDNSCSAWLLSITENLRVAIGELEMLHIILGRQRFFGVPRAPDYCHSVFLWQGQVIPAFDLGIYLKRVKTDDGATGNREHYICIVNYRDTEGSVRQGALLLHDLPVRISVSDEQMCDLPDDNDGLKKIAISCFKEPTCGPVPVLDLSRVFG